ncbi:MAG TPA: SpoVG family protein [Planctomycetota bacterium]|nr:SpoVG family protein [Planctomycetota bacterium]
MEITDIRVRLVSGKDEKLRAFVCIVLDGCFVVRDIKIISRANGLFVAMPSRKLSACCQQCRTKNHLRARFCNACGSRLPMAMAGAPTSGRGRAKLFADIAHPITTECRETFHRRIMVAYEEEVVRSRQPDYAPRYMPDDMDAVGIEDFEAYPGDAPRSDAGAPSGGDGHSVDLGTE